MTGASVGPHARNLRIARHGGGAVVLREERAAQHILASPPRSSSAPTARSLRPSSARILLSTPSSTICSSNPYPPDIKKPEVVASGFLLGDVVV